MPYVEIFNTVPSSSILMITLVSSFLGCPFRASLFIFFPPVEEKLCFLWDTEQENYLPEVVVQRDPEAVLLPFYFSHSSHSAFSILSKTDVGNK